MFVGMLALYDQLAVQSSLNSTQQRHLNLKPRVQLLVSDLVEVVVSTFNAYDIILQPKYASCWARVIYINTVYVWNILWTVIK